MSFFLQHRVTIISEIHMGDGSKGKSVARECSKGIYDICCRFNGGCNAGHTVVVNGVVHKTNQIPSGVFYKDREGNPMTCIIGSDTIDLEKLEVELSKYDNKIRDQILIADYCHIIKPEHIAYDKANDLVGTTHSGNGACLADKALRIGERVDSRIDSEGKVLGCRVIDCKKFFSQATKVLEIIGEGAQSTRLSINNKQYPYVTSAETIPTVICRMGLSHKMIVKVIVVSKGYITYVGKMKFQDMDDPALAAYQEIGKEYGTVTGRKRQCSYFDMTSAIEECYAVGADVLVVNKSDVMMEANKQFGYKFKILQDKEDGSKDTEGKPIREKVEFDTIEEFNSYIVAKLKAVLPKLEILFSYRADGLDLP